MDHGCDPETYADALWQALGESPEPAFDDAFPLPEDSSLLAWLDSVQILVGAETRK